MGPTPDRQLTARPDHPYPAQSLGHVGLSRHGFPWDFRAGCISPTMHVAGGCFRYWSPKGPPILPFKAPPGIDRSYYVCRCAYIYVVIDPHGQDGAASCTLPSLVHYSTAHSKVFSSHMKLISFLRWASRWR